MSELKNLKCPNCGAPIDPLKSGNKCAYCGAAYERIKTDSEKTADANRDKYTASFSSPSGKTYTFSAGASASGASPNSSTADPFCESAATAQSVTDVPKESMVFGRSAHQIAAILFSFLLGWVGGGYFYLGQTGKGVACVLFCWTGIPAIIGFVNMIIYATMNPREFEYKYPAR